MLFTIVEKVKGDNELVMYALAHLDGILEDNRARAASYIALIDDFNAPLNMIKILSDFLEQNVEKSDMAPHRDIAAHIISILIETADLEKLKNEFGMKPAEDFLNLLVRTKKQPALSPQAHTFALMTICK